MQLPFHFYGRRSARGLKPSEKALFERFMPSIEIKQASALEKPMLPDMSQYTALSLEIGFGGGEHLAALAAQNPTTLYIGSEVFINGQVSLLKHIEAKSLQNIFIFPSDVRFLLPHLTPQSLSAIYLLFADPWPKKRHHKRRLLNDETLTVFGNLLKDQGILRIASDHVSYQEWITAHLEKVSKEFLIRVSETRPSDWPPTRYEEKGAREGRKSRYWELIRTRS